MNSRTPKKKISLAKLSPRARQAMEIIYRLGEASASDVFEQAPDIPSYSAVRSILRSLESKGWARHVEKGLRYVYVPTAPGEAAVRSTLARLLDNFFQGSPAQAMKALIDVSRSDQYDLDFDELERVIEEAKKEGR